MKEDEIVRKLLSMVEDIQLDELVHAVASQQASNINNAGAEAQIRYLLENGITDTEILAQTKGDTP